MQSPLLLPRAQNFLMLRSILARGSMISCPQPWPFDLEIHAYAQYIETVRTAGVRLLGLDDVPDLYVHTAHRLSFKNIILIIVQPVLFCKSPA